MPKGIYSGPPCGIPPKVIKPVTIPKSPQFASRRKDFTHNINNAILNPQTNSHCKRNITTMKMLKSQVPKKIDISPSFIVMNNTCSSPTLDPSEKSKYTFKARPVPKLVPFVPKKSTKPLTAAIAPELITGTRRQSDSSCSRSSFEPVSKPPVRTPRINCSQFQPIHLFTEERALTRQQHLKPSTTPILYERLSQVKKFTSLKCSSKAGLLSSCRSKSAPAVPTTTAKINSKLLLQKRKILRLSS